MTNINLTDTGFGSYTSMTRKSPLVTLSQTHPVAPGNSQLLVHMDDSLSRR